MLRQAQHDKKETFYESIKDGRKVIIIFSQEIGEIDPIEALRGRGGGIEMLTEYLTAALESAHFEIIDDVEPHYGNIPALSGVWATGKTLEECRGNLAAALEDWVFFSIARGQELPALNGVSIAVPQRVTV